jgi:carotenoid cleavage dioxygenase-like enzyme
MPPAVRLPVEGALPGWLAGALLRTGPAKFEAGARGYSHWFDGLAMLHRFAFADGAVTYANRFLDSRAYRAARDTGRIAYSEFATDPCRTLFKRVVTSFVPPEFGDNANVNIARRGEEFVALGESPLPVRFDPGRWTRSASRLRRRASSPSLTRTVPLALPSWSATRRISARAAPTRYTHRTDMGSAG